MDLSPKAKLGVYYLLSILLPGALSLISYLKHDKIAGWMWAPAGVLTIILGFDYFIPICKKIGCPQGDSRNSTKVLWVHFLHLHCWSLVTRNPWEQTTLEVVGCRWDHSHVPRLQLEEHASK